MKIARVGESLIYHDGQANQSSRIVLSNDSILIIRDILLPRNNTVKHANLDTEGAALRKCLYSRNDLIKRVENERAFCPQGQSKLSVTMRCLY